MNAPDSIEIRRLQVRCHIGVPDEERSAPQVLLVSATMVPGQGFDGLGDEISRTVDYHAVALDIRQLAENRPRRLIETLALEIAEHLLQSRPLRMVRVTIEKHILPETECVAVHVERSRADF